MTAQQIIEEIKRLDPKEQLGVIRCAYKLDAERQLSGGELSKLAARMTETMTLLKQQQFANRSFAVSTAPNRLISRIPAESSASFA